MNNTTTELQWGDVIFKPGQRVRTTDASDYAGLDGVILEIHKMCIRDSILFRISDFHNVCTLSGF